MFDYYSNIYSFNLAYLGGLNLRPRLCLKQATSPEEQDEEECRPRWRKRLSMAFHWSSFLKFTFLLLLIAAIATACFTLPVEKVPFYHLGFLIFSFILNLYWLIKWLVWSGFLVTNSFLGNSSFLTHLGFPFIIIIFNYSPLLVERRFLDLGFSLVTITLLGYSWFLTFVRDVKVSAIDICV